jgi:hypothetical protein
MIKMHIFLNKRIKLYDFRAQNTIFSAKPTFVSVIITFGAVSTGAFASVFASIFPSVIAPLHLQGTNPRNHGRKNGSICVFAQKTDEVEMALKCGF